MASARPIKLPPRRTGLAAVARRQNLPTLGLAAVALALAVLIGHDVFFPSNPNPVASLQLATVGTGTVTNSVSSSGTLMPAQQMNLGFKTAGTLTEVDVRSGDHVSAGQVLARIDTTPLQIALQTAQAQLASAQATLSNTLSGTSLQQSLDSLNQARQSYNDAVNQANTTNSNDQATLNTDQATLNSDQVALNNDVLALQNSVLLQSDQRQLTYDQGVLQTDSNKFVADGCPTATLPYSGTCATDNTNLHNDQNKINADKLQITNDQNAAAPNYISDQARVPADQARVSADNSRLSSDQSAGQRSITQAQNSITNAQDNYNNQSVNRPATIQQEQAQVASSSAQVDTAQNNLDAAILTAPAAGVISTVTAQVGDGVSALTSGSGAEAPGSTALLPSSTSSSGSSAASGGSAFMTLLSDKSYVAVVSFAESDAAKIAAGQTGTVTFDAVSGLSVPAHVLAVAASATVSSNVVNYYVTLALDSTDSRLKPGLTSNATVVTARAANVLVIPNRAITRLGNLATVTVLEAGKKVATQVTLGIAGSNTTQVVSGLTAGQKVVLPTARTTGTTTTGPGGGRGFGGGGGGGGLITGGG